MENRDIILIVAVIAVLLIFVFANRIAMPYARFAKNNFACPNCGYQFKTKRGLIIALLSPMNRLIRTKFCPKCKFRK